MVPGQFKMGEHQTKYSALLKQYIGSMMEGITWREEGKWWEKGQKEPCWFCVLERETSLERRQKRGIFVRHSLPPPQHHYHPHHHNCCWSYVLEGDWSRLWSCKKGIFEQQERSGEGFLSGQGENGKRKSKIWKEKKAEKEKVFFSLLSFLSLSWLHTTSSRSSDCSPGRYRHHHHYYYH